MAYARLSVRKGIGTNAELRIYYYALAIRKLEKERIKKKKSATAISVTTWTKWTDTMLCNRSQTLRRTYI